MVKRLLQCDRVDVNMQVKLSYDCETSGDSRQLFDRNYSYIGKTAYIKIIYQDTDERHTALIAAVNNNDVKVTSLLLLFYL